MFYCKVQNYKILNSEKKLNLATKKDKYHNINHHFTERKPVEN